MLISCKCLNFIAISSSQQSQLLQAKQKLNSSSAVITADDAAAPTAAAPSTAVVAAAVAPSLAAQPSQCGGPDEDCSMSSNGIVAGTGNSTSGNNNTATSLMHAFLQKYPRNFIFYSQCMDLFKQSIGPIPDLAINAINQRELIYSITLDVQQMPHNNNSNTNNQLPTQSCQPQTWQISICINCNTALCAKRIAVTNYSSSNPQTPELLAHNGHNIAPLQLHMQQQQQQYLINCALLTNNEELLQRRNDKSFSETFGLLILDHPQLENGHNQQQQNHNHHHQQQQHLQQHPQQHNHHFNGGIGAAILEPKQQRLRQLQHHMQQRLQQEIADTDERIQRYTEQQFALLKSFREKSEQECRLLLNLIQYVPELHNELLDQVPPALEVSGGAAAICAGNGASSYVLQRRRNTIGSRRDLQPPTTPTTPNALLLMQPNFMATTAAAASAATTNVVNDAAATAATNTALQLKSQSQLNGGGTNNFGAFNNRKMSNFDTPPATPEATPMSVGNSPTFRQQQTTFGARLASSSSFQQQFPTPTVESADDCLFELEGVDDGMAPLNMSTSSTVGFHVPSTAMQQRNHHAMSDLDESEDDSAEEAEDALDLDTSMPIPMLDAQQRRRRTSSLTTAQMLNFAKSLPIQIANSPLAERSLLAHAPEEDDELDNTVDIAASIKALAKSVHGEAVFGDLPRPRLRSQI